MQSGTAEEDFQPPPCSDDCERTLTSNATVIIIIRGLLLCGLPIPSSSILKCVRACGRTSKKYSSVVFIFVLPPTSFTNLTHLSRISRMNESCWRETLCHACAKIQSDVDDAYACTTPERSSCLTATSLKRHHGNGGITYGGGRHSSVAKTPILLRFVRQLSRRRRKKVVWR